MQKGKTGKGYVYYRDRSNGTDTTVYEHQIMALQYYDAKHIFSDDTDVHHHAPAPDANIPWLLTVVDTDDHKGPDTPDQDLTAYPPLWDIDKPGLGGTTAGP